MKTLLATQSDDAILLIVILAFASGAVARYWQLKKIRFGLFLTGSDVSDLFPFLIGIVIGNVTSIINEECFGFRGTGGFIVAMVLIWGAFYLLPKYIGCYAGDFFVWVEKLSNRPAKTAKA